MNRLSRLTRRCLLFFLVGWAIPDPQALWAQSAIPLLSGFDQQRVEATFPINDEPTAGEAAKLVYRLRRIDPKTLSDLGQTGNPRSGDVTEIDGVIQEIGTWRIPDRLTDFLELRRLQEVLIDSQQQGAVRVITAGLADRAAAGDRVTGFGVLIKSHEDATAVAAGRLKWFPRRSQNVGVAMLSDKGVDAAALADLSSRDRMPLVAEDADVFYSVLRAAAELPGTDDTAIAPPELVDPVALLRDPGEMGGQWLRMTLTTVRVTRITVSDDARREQLGRDHYYQIDASGELDNVVVSIARPEGQSGDPIQFENSYPVSVAVRELPAFLRRAIVELDGTGAVSTMISRPIRIDGFFLRLWSYESDYMQRLGGGKQFGPLIIASRIVDLAPESSDPIGVRMIGWLAAAGVVISLLGIAVWSRIVASRDSDARRKRKSKEAEQLELPRDF